jgi:hypothetical protein
MTDAAEIRAAILAGCDIDEADLDAALRGAIAADEDNDNEDKEDLEPPAPSSRPNTEPNAKDRLGETIMKRMLANHSSASEYVRFFRFRKDRNQHEARRLAQVIDSARSASVSLKYDFMEMLIRNLAGICEVDKYNNPALLDKIEFAPPQELIPRDIFRALTKDAKRDSEMRKSANKKNKTPGDGSTRAGGH